MKYLLLIIAFITLSQSNQNDWRFINVKYNQPTLIHSEMNNSENIMIKIQNENDLIMGEIKNFTSESINFSTIEHSFLNDVRTEIFLDSSWMLFQKTQNCNITCGNSYYQSPLARNHSLSFEFKTPPKGNIEAKVRFGIEIDGKYINSNPISLTIKSEHIKEARKDDVIICPSGQVGKIISVADSCYSIKDYEKAKLLYERASMFYPTSKHLKNQIQNCEKELDKK